MIYGTLETQTVTYHKNEFNQTKYVKPKLIHTMLDLKNAVADKAVYVYVYLWFENSTYSKCIYRHRVLTDTLVGYVPCSYHISYPVNMGFIKSNGIYVQFSHNFGAVTSGCNFVYEIEIQ